jgi:hypothetical protein
LGTVKRAVLNVNAVIDAVVTVTGIIAAVAVQLPMADKPWLGAKRRSLA